MHIKRTACRAVSHKAPTRHLGLAAFRAQSLQPSRKGLQPLNLFNLRWGFYLSELAKLRVLATVTKHRAAQLSPQHRKKPCWKAPLFFQDAQDIGETPYLAFETRIQLLAECSCSSVHRQNQVEALLEADTMRNQRLARMSPHHAALR
jgi:hypothetical protein